jgi:hypothetical protein
LVIGENSGTVTENRQNRIYLGKFGVDTPCPLGGFKFLVNFVLQQQ